MAGAAFSKDSDHDGGKPHANLYGGPGTINLRYFSFAQAARPANFVLYDIPPGAGEGVHTHRLGDPQVGPFDEYYYIIQGQGRMEIDGQPVDVRAGDHIHAPLGVAHGIVNTAPTEILKVFVTFIDRS